MSLFNCEKCGVIENTALCGYNFRGKGKALCSECDPNIRKWHNCFVMVYRKLIDKERCVKSELNDKGEKDGK